MLKLFYFLIFFAFLPNLFASEKEGATKKFLIFSPGEGKGQYVLRNAPKTVSSAPRVSVEVKKDKSKKSEPEADAPAEIKTEVKPEVEEKVDDDDF